MRVSLNGGPIEGGARRFFSNSRRGLSRIQGP